MTCARAARGGPLRDEGVDGEGHGVAVPSSAVKYVMDVGWPASAGSCHIDLRPLALGGRATPHAPHPRRPKLPQRFRAVRRHVIPRHRPNQKSRNP